MHARTCIVVGSAWEVRVGRAMESVCTHDQSSVSGWLACIVNEHDDAPEGRAGNSAGLVERVWAADVEPLGRQRIECIHSPRTARQLRPGFPVPSTTLRLNHFAHHPVMRSFNVPIIPLRSTQ